MQPHEHKFSSVGSWPNIGIHSVVELASASHCSLMTWLCQRPSAVLVRTI
jgi:hypothetical protein